MTLNLVENYTMPIVACGNSKNTKKSLQNENSYKDPLRKWPLKGLAYSNELGAVVSPISSKLGTALWVPALMYFGADIYDKYKNDNTDYSPSGKRGLKEAIFQALASVILPTAAVKAGQKTISLANRFTKTGLSTQAKEDAHNFVLDFMGQNKLHEYADNVVGYKKLMKESLNNVLVDNLGEYHSKSPIRKMFSLLFSNKNYAELSLSKPDKVSKFLDKKVDTIFNMREQLMQNKKPKQLSKKLFKKFNELQPKYLSEFGEERYLGKAAKSVLKDFEKAQIFKNKIIKTLGGFIALGLLAKPIDDFVDNIVIQKTIEPGLDKIMSNNHQAKNN